MKKISLVFLTIFACTILNAQNKLILTLDSAKNYALQYNRTLIKSGLSIKAAQAQLWQAISQGLPQVDGSIDYNNNLGASASFAGQTIKFKPSSSAQITASQLIFSGNYWVGIELSKLSKKIAESSMVKTELDVKNDVSLTFYNILMAEQNKVIVEKNLDNLRDIYQKTLAMYKAGIAEETDADQLSIQVLSTETMLKSVERQIETAYNLLRIQLGVNINVEIELVGNLENMVGDVNINTLLKNDLNLGDNIDYMLVKEQENIMGKQVKFAKSSYLPTISAFYNFNYKLLKPELDFAPKHTLGLKATIPLFSSGSRLNKVKEAKFNLKSAQMDVEQATDQLYMQDKQLRFNLQTAYDQYETQSKNIVIARKVYNSMKVKYDQGVISSLDLTTANSNYLQAENSYLSAMLGLLQAQNELEKLLGIL